MQSDPMMPRLELRGLTKRFGTAIANDSVTLSVQPGEIHALLGENGAGKSTLVKMVYGVLRPDAGEILWEGQAQARLDPRGARRLGIGMVFQHFSLFEAMTVLENVALGLDAPGPLPALAARIETISASYGLTLDPARRVHTLSVGERQRIEIVRCLLQSPRLLVMDEPTSVLAPGEVETLFATLRQLSAQGCSILYISHKLGEIRALCSAATVLRAGRVAGACDPRQESEAGLARLMMGAEPSPAPRVARPPHKASAGWWSMDWTCPPPAPVAPACTGSRWTSAAAKSPASRASRATARPSCSRRSAANAPCPMPTIS